LAGYADPHNFVYPFMHSNGYYGKFMALRNAEIDKLCELTGTRFMVSCPMPCLPMTMRF
jgi:ABC-type oligopeptide transport system substrate-binding subunit